MTLQVWKQTSLARILLTRLVSFILCPSATKTTRSYIGYTGPQMASLGLIPETTYATDSINDALKLLIREYPATFTLSLIHISEPTRPY